MFIGLFVQGVRAQGAGCHYGASSKVELHAGGQPGKLSQNAWWSTAAVRCVYDSGNLLYFQVSADSGPCNGPGCRGKLPDDRMQAPLVIEWQRQSLVGELAVTLTCGKRPPVAWFAQESALPSSPVLSGVLRPPRV